MKISTQASFLALVMCVAASAVSAGDVIKRIPSGSYTSATSIDVMIRVAPTDTSTFITSAQIPPIIAIAQGICAPGLPPPPLMTEKIVNHGDYNDTYYYNLCTGQRSMVQTNIFGGSASD